MRIISTVPSQTELLSYLGLDEQIVGITKFCVHPEHIYRSVPRIGGTKELDIDKIRSIQPDLIIANKEENLREQIETLQEEFEVYISDVKGLESALMMISEVGVRVNKEAEAVALVSEIGKRFENLTIESNRTVLYLIWNDPYMSVGHDTFIHDMLLCCGLSSVTGHLDRYPIVKAGEFEPDLIFLSSEPFPFKQRHLKEVQRHWPKAELQLVDGEFFSWYGPRMLGALDYFEKEITLPHRQ